MRRAFGFLFLVAAVLGFLFSLFGVIQIWIVRPSAIEYVQDTLGLFDQTLSTTQNSLILIGEGIKTTAIDVTSLQATTHALAQMLKDTAPMLESLTDLAGKDLPSAVLATKTSLASAQSSAQLIDSLLATLSKIPFLPLPQYNPDVPLHTALADVSTNLDSLTPTLAVIYTSLNDGQKNLRTVQKELEKIAATTDEIGAVLDQALLEIDQYKIATAQLRQRITAMQQASAGAITAMAFTLTAVLTWLIVAQIGMALQGIELLRHKSI